MKSLKLSLALLVIVILGLLLMGCKAQPTEMQIIQSKIDQLASSYASTRSISSTASQETFKEVVLVDQGFEGINDIHGIDRLRAMGTKIVAGTLEEAFLYVELTRGDYTNKFGSVAMYVMPYNDGMPVPELETKRFEFIDSQWIGNCTRAISPKSGLTTIGTKSIEKTYDMASFPVTPLDPCDTGVRYHNYVNAINNENPNVDFAFGFMPSDSRDHVKVTLRYRGNITISNF